MHMHMRLNVYWLGCCCCCCCRRLLQCSLTLQQQPCVSFCFALLRDMTLCGQG